MDERLKNERRKLASVREKVLLIVQILDLLAAAGYVIFPADLIPDLLGMVFDCNVVEMSVRSAMGESIEGEYKEGHPYFATLNLHSDRLGSFERVDFSPEIERFIIRKNIYKKPGDEVEYFDNASKALGIVFFKFDNAETMNRILGSINEHISIEYME